MPKRKKLIESFDGVGKVYRKDEHISDVRYSLQIYQEYIISRSLSGTDEIPGMKDISGQISVISGERHLIDQNDLTLYLQDKRKMTFFASRGDPISGVYRIVNMGKGIISE